MGLFRPFIGISNEILQPLLNNYTAQTNNIHSSQREVLNKPKGSGGKILILFSTSELSLFLGWRSLPGPFSSAPSATLSVDTPLFSGIGSYNPLSSWVSRLYLPGCQFCYQQVQLGLDSARILLQGPVVSTSMQSHRRSFTKSKYDLFAQMVHRA